MDFQLQMLSSVETAMNAKPFERNLKFVSAGQKKFFRRYEAVTKKEEEKSDWRINVSSVALFFIVCLALPALKLCEPMGARRQPHKYIFNT